jgi:beta-galactosidase
MKIGTYYYPEQWPKTDWARDLDNIVKMGLQLIHLGEFAWGTLEPAQDQFEFGWLDEVIALAKDRGLDVILCTPTAVLPVWLAEKHPDVFFSGGRFGGRRHANHLHPVVRERTAKVVRALAERYGQAPHVIGWQIDNEIGGGLHDQSEHTHAAWREWLRHKYGTIDSLNRAWGCAFWNTFYTSFEQVKFPGSRDPEYRNQHETTDAQRFQSWHLAQYVKLQADILKAYVGDRWITTNFMPFFPDIDPGACLGSLSLWSWDTYPISGFARDAQDESYRLADPNGVAFLHDQMASYNGHWGLMEVQPGQINWSGYPVRPLPGAIRLLLWQAIAHQAEFITVYRFRQPRFGIEMWHDGLVQWDGQTPSPGGEQFSQVVRELKEIGDAKDYAAIPRDQTIPTIAVLHDHDQLFSYLSMPQSKRWNQRALLVNYHSAIERLGLHAAVTQIDSDWSRFPVLIVPALQMADDETVQKLYDYVKQGGHLVTTARTAVLDTHGIAPDGLYEHRLFDLIGSTIIGYDALPEETFGEVEFGGRSHRWGVWGDLIRPGPTAQTLGTYTDQHYAGTAAVVRNAYGKGTVTHVGPIDDGTLADDVVERIARDLNYPVTVIPRRTKLHRLADGVRVFLNFTVFNVDAPAGETANFLVGDRIVKAGDVAVWRE